MGYASDVEAFLAMALRRGELQEVEALAADPQASLGVLSRIARVHPYLVGARDAAQRSHELLGEAKTEEEKAEALDAWMRFAYAFFLEEGKIVYPLGHISFELFQTMRDHLLKLESPPADLEPRIPLGTFLGFLVEQILGWSTIQSEIDERVEQGLPAQPFPSGLVRWISTYTESATQLILEAVVNNDTEVRDGESSHMDAQVIRTRSSIRVEDFDAFFSLLSLERSLDDFSETIRPSLSRLVRDGQIQIAKEYMSNHPQARQALIQAKGFRDDGSFASWLERTAAQGGVAEELRRAALTDIANDYLINKRQAVREVRAHRRISIRGRWSDLEDTASYTVTVDWLIPDTAAEAERFEKKLEGSLLATTMEYLNFISSDAFWQLV